jgi:hypothetical protein
MGIDDPEDPGVMAITMTEDWMREVDDLATPEFAVVNADNQRRVAAEPVPASVREPSGVRPAHPARP